MAIVRAVFTSERESIINEAGNVNPFQVRLQGIVIFETADSLEYIEAHVVIYLDIKAIELIQED